MDDIYPCIIIYDRYQGTYSGALWTAWNLNFNDIPPEINGEDICCSKFWSINSKKYIIGKGCTPVQAYQDLARKLK